MKSLYYSRRTRLESLERRVVLAGGARGALVNFVDVATESPDAGEVVLPLDATLTGTSLAPGTPLTAGVSAQSPPRLQRSGAGGGFAWEAETRYVTADTPGSHTTTPGIAAFGVNVDGVADLSIRRSDGTFRCTGSLLTTGRHLLTAAHCLTNDVGVLNTFVVDATFELPGGDITARGRTFHVHPDWDGSFFEEGNDIAIVEFNSEVSPDVPRYEIYRGPASELNQSSVHVGYGSSGHGNSGTTLPSGTKRAVLNLYDSDATVFNGTNNGQAQLAYDFDNGLAENDAFDFFFNISELGFGVDEGMSAPGDSGGPTFINDGGTHRIAGITSYGLRLRMQGNPLDLSLTSDVDLFLNSSFGEFGVDTRVGSFVPFVDGVINPETSSIHVGDLDGRVRMRPGAQRWIAMVFVVVHDDSEQAAGGGVTVTGTWSGDASGTDTAVTRPNGRAVFRTSVMGGSTATFTVDTIDNSLPYNAGDNHDPDSDSDGTSITLVNAGGMSASLEGAAEDESASSTEIAYVPPPALPAIEVNPNSGGTTPNPLPKSEPFEGAPTFGDPTWIDPPLNPPQVEKQPFELSQMLAAGAALNKEGTKSARLGLTVRDDGGFTADVKARDSVFEELLYGSDLML